MTVHGSSQRSHTASTASTIVGRTTATIRSCDSEIMISHGSSSSRSGTRSRWTSMPTSRAISARDEASPAAPQSWSDSTRPPSTSSSETSIRRLPVNGSPIWTRRALVRVVLPELRAREHRGAADPVAAGRRAEQHHRVPGADRAGPLEPVDGEDADAHRVHEAVVARRPRRRWSCRRRSGRRRSCRSGRSRRRRGRTPSPARRRRGRRGARSAARPSRRCRGGSRRRRWPRPGTARPRTGGCATPP